MGESVSVDHGGQSITTNTMSEADLRTEMEAPAAGLPLEAPESSGGNEGQAGAKSGGNQGQAAEASPAGPLRDEHGRFLPKDQQTAAPDGEPPPAEPAADPAAPTRRRDDTLPRHDPIARMKQALAQKTEAERRAAALEAELARYRQPTLPTPAAPPPNGNGPGLSAGPEPQFDQFADAPDPYTAYLQAWTRWDRATALAEARATWEAEQTTKTRAAQFEARLAAGRTAFPDFDQVLTEADTLGLQVSAVMQDAIAESPHAADLVYFLATHPEECLQLAEESRQTPVAAAPLMRRLLESHLAPRAVPTNGGTGAAARASVSTAKPPVSPVGSSPVVSDAPPGESASAAEHARYWNHKLKVPGTR